MRLTGYTRHLSNGCARARVRLNGTVPTPSVLLWRVKWGRRVMSDHFSKAVRYRQQAGQCVAMAKAATSNKIRAHHYAAAERYLQLADKAAKVASFEADGVLSRRLRTLVQLSHPHSQPAE